MELYQKLDLENKLLGLLSGMDSHSSEHKSEKPFLTAYQIAILFNEQYPNDVEEIKKPFGGKNTGQHNSLVQYLGQVLSLLADRDGASIEKAYLWRGNLQTLVYNNDGNSVENSLGTTYDLSIYRIK